MLPDFITAAEAVRARLSEEGFAHSMRVADTAAALASIYGVDHEAARLAGILHDWDKELAPGELAAAARGARRTPVDAEDAVPYLLHAQSGAAAAAAVLGALPADVVRAIERHTVGAEEMTDLDMVVYAADSVEPGRRFAGVNDLREAVGTVSLQALFALCYERSVQHVVSTRRHLHPVTVAVWNRYVAENGVNGDPGRGAGS